MYGLTFSERRSKKVIVMIEIESGLLDIGPRSEMPAEIVNPVLAALIPSREALMIRYCLSCSQNL